ncbi:MAG: DUF427 domain-containing protein [Actinomycetota bacterium]
MTEAPIRIEHRSSHIRVEVDGVTVADSFHPVYLHETGLPVRYYLPPSDVRMDLLTPTDKHTVCPWKGTASYWSVRIGDRTHSNIVWGYPTPNEESAGIAGLLCFYNEKVDLFVDGELQAK